MWSLKTQFSFLRRVCPSLFILFFFKDKRLVAYEGWKINNPQIRHLISLVKKQNKNNNLILHSHLTHTTKTCFASHQSVLMGAV